MIQAKCIQKFRDKNNNIIGYRLIDINGETQDVKSENLKNAIRKKIINVVNLTLTSDNRLVDSESKAQLKCSILGEEPGEISKLSEDIIVNALDKVAVIILKNIGMDRDRAKQVNPEKYTKHNNIIEKNYHKAIILDDGITVCMTMYYYDVDNNISAVFVNEQNKRVIARAIVGRIPSSMIKGNRDNKTEPKITFSANIEELANTIKSYMYDEKLKSDKRKEYNCDNIDEICREVIDNVASMYYDWVLISEIWENMTDYRGPHDEGDRINDILCENYPDCLQSFDEHVDVWIEYFWALTERLPYKGRKELEATNSVNSLLKVNKANTSVETEQQFLTNRALLSKSMWNLAKGLDKHSELIKKVKNKYNKEIEESVGYYPIVFDNDGYIYEVNEKVSRWLKQQSVKIDKEF